MHLIIGGAYQGKTDYAKAAFGLRDGDIYTCTEGQTAVDFSRPCIDSLEQFTLACVRAGVDGVAYFRQHREEWQGSIFICRDIACGVVPLGADMRAWRQMTGRLCQLLAKDARSVRRIFCGLEQRLK